MEKVVKYGAISFHESGKKWKVGEWVLTYLRLRTRKELRVQTCCFLRIQSNVLKIACSFCLSHSQNEAIIYRHISTFA
jgi:hypothetical protein